MRRARSLTHIYSERTKFIRFWRWRHRKANHSHKIHIEHSHTRSLNIPTHISETGWLETETEKKENENIF